MNEKNEKVSEESILDASNTAQPPVRSPSRRRLIKLGAAGVPVVATLASSPAMAWDCKLPSAWGSTNLATSQSGNSSNIVRGIENCWTITNWRDNTSRGFGAPWDVLKKAPYNCVFANATSYRSVTVNDLVKKGAIATVPKSLNGSETVYNVLNSGSDFSKFIITAMLNWAVSPAKSNIQLCTRGTGGANQLVYMAKGTYYPSGGNPNKPWDDATIIKYLNNNYLAYNGYLMR